MQKSQRQQKRHKNQNRTPLCKSQNRHHSQVSADDQSFFVKRAHTVEKQEQKRFTTESTSLDVGVSNSKKKMTLLVQEKKKA